MDPLDVFFPNFDRRDAWAAPSSSSSQRCSCSFRESEFTPSSCDDCLDSELRPARFCGVAGEEKLSLGGNPDRINEDRSIRSMGGFDLFEDPRAECSGGKIDCDPGIHVSKNHNVATSNVMRLSKVLEAVDSNTDFEESCNHGKDGNYFESCTGSSAFETKHSSPKQESPLQAGLKTTRGDSQCNSIPLEVKSIVLEATQFAESQELGKSASESHRLSNVSGFQVHPSTEAHENKREGLIGNLKPDSLASVFTDSKRMALQEESVHHFEDQPALSKIEDLKLEPFHDEVVHEMEEVLLGGENSGFRLHQGMMLQSHLSTEYGSTASTSGTDECYLPLPRSLRIDGIEVVGAKQKTGDVSLGERLVGVKEFTVYILSVRSGNDQWEVEHRYRDFCTLHHRLKSFYADKGWILPSPWSSIDQESRNIFGSTSPDIIAQRSSLIQQCIQSILHSKCSSSLPGSLIWFLSPQKSVITSSASNSAPLTFFTQVTDGETIESFGKTISLIVNIQHHKSMKQLLEAQLYTCAGCHKSIDEGNTIIGDFVQTFGWGKPRICEYTGQLFCSSCHTNDTAVLPAKVLHHWDFSQYPVSQLAKSYLDSINDQPMLCVSAVNPFLFPKVPALLHVMGVRKKIAAVFPNVRCSFRRSVIKGLGPRGYLLESNDFFALKDLVDISKGAFAALPVMAETILRNVLEHITEHCLVCCDVGVPCGARQACDDLSSLVFPFQEGEIEKCTSCDLVFHKPCFERLKNCPCGAHLNADEAIGCTSNESGKAGGDESRTAVGFLSGLFSRA